VYSHQTDIAGVPERKNGLVSGKHRLAERPDDRRREDHR
jgi:hypothetical protein